MIFKKKSINSFIIKKKIILKITTNYNKKQSKIKINRKLNKNYCIYSLSMKILVFFFLHIKKNKF